MASVTLTNISKIYPGGVHAVRNFNLQVRDGELIVLVGPSGSGKSTILRLISGLEDPASGDIEIGGRPVSGISPGRCNVAMVFQDYALYPHMTVFENMAFGLKVRRTPREAIDLRVREAASVLGIVELLSRRPATLSGGQKQRVALGRALVRKPAAFLFDEPLSNLDARLRFEMRAEILRLHQKFPTTMIYVTHDQAEAMTMGDRIVVVNEGVLQQVGEPLMVYDRPANIFVAGFIGSPAMNFLHGRVIQKRGQLTFDGGNFQTDLPGTRPGEGMEGKRLVCGIRPEAMSIHSTPRAIELSCRIEIVEALGAETLAYCRGGPHRFVARFPASEAPKRGDVIVLYVSQDQCRYFDNGTGLVVELPRQ
jgi:multiple sugar transport system ATP-binding protein